MSEAFTELEEEFPVQLDPGKHMIVSVWGRKGSGKSVFNRKLYRSYPWDKIAVDVNGNAEPGEDAIRMSEPTKRFPPPPDVALGQQRRRYQNIHFRGDPGSATYRDDLDRAVGMALFPQKQPVCLWGGEVGEMMPNGRPGPNMRRLLMQNRHYNVTALFDGPRPVNVDPLVIGQSNLVVVYHLPNPDDRERIAKTVGWPAKRFHQQCEETWRRGKYWFLLFDVDEHRLYQCPPLPLDE